MGNSLHGRACFLSGLCIYYTRKGYIAFEQFLKKNKKQSWSEVKEAKKTKFKCRRKKIVELVRARSGS